jgi:hypothetical protein
MPEIKKSPMTVGPFNNSRLVLFLHSFIHSDVGDKSRRVCIFLFDC